MDWTNWSRFWSTKSTTTTSRKPLRWSLKNLRWKRMYLLLRADQRLKQDHEDLPVLAHLQELYVFVKEYGLILNQELNPITRTQWQKDWVLFFVMVIYLEKKMGRLNSGDQKINFGTILRTLSIGLMKCGRVKWQEAEATWKGFNIVLTRQDKKCFISELFSGRNPIDPRLQDTVLIPDNFEYIDHIGCAINLHSSQIQDWKREDKIQAGKDRQYSLQSWIPCIRIT